MTRIMIVCIVLLTMIGCGETKEKSDFDKLVDMGQMVQANDYFLNNPEADFGTRQLLILGKYFNEMTRYDISKPIFEQLIKQDSANPVAKLFLANIYRESGDYNTAMPLYDAIVDVDSIRLLVLPERARLFIMINEEQRALADIEAAKAISDKYFAIFVAEGLYYNTKGKSALALDQFELAESLDPGVSSEASLYAGIILMKLGVNLDAMEKFSRAIETRKNINLGYAFINRGICQMNLRDSAFACNDFDSASKYMPAEAEYYVSSFCMNHGN